VTVNSFIVTKRVRDFQDCKNGRVLPKPSSIEAYFIQRPNWSFEFGYQTSNLQDIDSNVKSKISRSKNFLEQKPNSEVLS